MLPVRGARGYAVYAAGMEASAVDKAKMLRFVRPGLIVELGCGNGTVLELLRRKFPRSRLVGVDCSPEMIRRCRRRFPGFEFLKKDITFSLFKPGSVDTIVLCSILHEVFSYKGYDYSAVRRTLAHCAAALRPGGRLVIRDGVKPARQDAVYLTFRNAATEEKFRRFSTEFGSSEIVWRAKDGRIQVARRDAMEFLTKYIYDVNWKYEVKEQFGVFTLTDWGVELRKAGFRVLHRESYLIDWLRKTHWSKDVRMEAKTARGYRSTPYPDSTMLIAAQK
ncbi:MAG: methyltransferase domain-containing protein [Planctomycetaceae bacterium]|nr:methyltransferase domain-containing protein [Planctomycetaceae bacterium]